MRADKTCHVNTKCIRVLTITVPTGILERGNLIALSILKTETRTHAVLVTPCHLK